MKHNNIKLKIFRNPAEFDYNGEPSARMIDDLNRFISIRKILDPILSGDYIYIFYEDEEND